MGLFDDVSRFLEDRLEEFLRNHPHLELQALEEQLREQEEGTLQLIADLQRQGSQLETEILNTAKEVQRWHGRVEKAKAAGRLDLANPAQEREAALLRQGNQLWGKMEGVKQRLKQAQELQRKIQQRRQEVKVKAAQVAAERSRQQTQQSWQTPGWSQQPFTRPSPTDPLEQQFQRWELDDEMERLKRNMS